MLIGQLNLVPVMKGVVFTEFLDLVDQEFGEVTVDQIVEESDLPSHCVYTAVGTYDYSELDYLLSSLANKSGISKPALLMRYGEHLFGRFTTLYPAFLSDASDVFSFLERVETQIHVEVLKLYPDAELPTFESERLSPQCFKMTYRSQRPLQDLCEGLIRGAMKHFDEEFVISRQDQSSQNETQFVFTITRV
ncbi:heme NO-binding domain-containing protein [Pelagibius sp. Alg239-R121]|uniref:heme NO-binding domain-containing protein n=1 Tax=Pelagibius sp. Alg239-R121 TaxID=2993448 RepID=UPI0024A6F756|nr:heme NO-binding domain-containing protein [Pelagibius sp. Alg239-R121]